MSVRISTFFFVAIVVSGCGISGGPSLVPLSPPTPQIGSGSTAPLAPTNILATAGGGELTLSWTGAEGATSYNVYCSAAAINPATDLRGSFTASPALVTGLASGIPMFCFVTSVRDGIESPSSDTASAIPL